MLSGYNQIISLRYEHFDSVISITKIMLTIVQSFLFDNLVLLILQLHLILSRCVPSCFLIESVTYACTLLFLFDDEIWLVIIAFFLNQRVFTNSFQNICSIFFIFLPSRYVIVCRLVLKPF